MGTIAGKCRPTPFEKLLEQVRQFTCYQAWNLGIVYQPAADIVRRGIVGEVQWFPTPRRRTMLADPSCRLGPDSELTLYAEYLDYRHVRGEIWVAHVSSGQDPITARLAPLLVQDFHMSYPFPFVDESGASLLTAEAWQAGHAPLWRESNGTCEYVGPLFPNRMVIDPTILHTRDHWWLFCTFEDEDPNSRLHLFYKTHLGDSWIAHRRNPVKVDLSSSRPAGPIFQADNVLIRPAQDCVRTYGRAVVLNAIRRLDPDEFEEEPLRRLEPLKGPYPHGLHTLCPAGDVTLIDGKRWRVDPEGFFDRMRTGARMYWERSRPS